MTKKTAELNTVECVEPKKYLALSNLDLSKVVATEMKGMDAVFERIKMPSGDTTVFQIPSDDPEEPELVKEFSAVILYHHPIRAYFKDKYTGAITLPDCGSLDAVNGFGEPGGICEHCRYNVYGTGENNSKACKERRRLYLLREGEIFPIMLSLPTGSLKEFTRYVMRCLSKGRKTNGVVTRFALVKTTNKGGIAYAKATFSIERELAKDEAVVIGKMTEELKKISHRIGFEGTDIKKEKNVSLENKGGEATFNKTA